MKDKWLLMLGGLMVVIAVFGLKVWHAQGICGDLGGSWSDGECNFDEQSVLGGMPRR